jgi:hypothetical protein
VRTTCVRAVIRRRGRRRKPPSFSQFLEKEGGWGMVEGRKLAQDSDRKRNQRAKKPPLSPEGEGLGVRRSGSPSPLVRSGNSPSQKANPVPPTGRTGLELSLCLPPARSADLAAKPHPAHLARQNHAQSRAACHAGWPAPAASRLSANAPDAPAPPSAPAASARPGAERSGPRPPGTPDSRPQTRWSKIPLPITFPSTSPFTRRRCPQNRSGQVVVHSQSKANCWGYD